MIDDSDGDEVWILSLFSRGWWGILLLAIACVLWFIAANNRVECEAKTCPAGEHAKLLDHECVCVGPPR